MKLLDAACTRSGTVDPETWENKKAATVNVASSFVAIAQGEKFGLRAVRSAVDGDCFSLRPMLTMKEVI